jgi:hypothetical protein
LRFRTHAERKDAFLAASSAMLDEVRILGAESGYV